MNGWKVECVDIVSLIMATEVVFSSTGCFRVISSICTLFLVQQPPTITASPTAMKTKEPTPHQLNAQKMDMYDTPLARFKTKSFCSYYFIHFLFLIHFTFSVIYLSGCAALYD